MKGEIGKLSEKEFRIMLVKMIRNLENKLTVTKGKRVKGERS